MMGRMAARTLIDENQAAEMLRNQKPVRDVAEHFGVTTQAVYRAIKAGRLPRVERHGGPLVDRIGSDATPDPTARAGTTPKPE